MSYMWAYICSHGSFLLLPLTKSRRRRRRSAASMAVGLFSTVAFLAGLCAKHVRRVSKKLAASSQRGTSSSEIATTSPSPLITSSKQLLTTLSNKAMAPFLHKKRNGDGAGTPEEEGIDGYGDGGLWQREIMMGEKCQPIDFSGVILYDTDGRRVSQLPPRSPRSTPLQTSFSFPAVAPAMDLAGK